MLKSKYTLVRSEMGKLYPLILVVILISVVSCKEKKNNILAQKSAFCPWDSVNVFMGTADDFGQLSPAASLPFGMVKLGPETAPTNHSGYNFNSKKIKGFTHNRSEGVGCVGAGGNILIKPGIGVVDSLDLFYRKDSENAKPGFYEVILEDKGQPIKVELTVSNSTGWHRYTFPENKNSWLMVDLTYSHEEFIEENHEINNNQELSGDVSAFTVCKQNGGRYKFYYNLEIDKKVEDIIYEGTKIFFLLKQGGSNIVNVKTTLSTISPQQAKKDRGIQIAKTTFEELKEEAKVIWNKKLGKIQVDGKVNNVKLFYSNLYRSFLSPYNITSTDGTYRGSDGKVYSAEGFTYYHGWSIWDTFRTKMPLLTLIDAEVMQDFCRSLVALYKQGKHSWASTTEPFPTVRTEHSALVLLDAYRKGITDFDLKGVYPYLIRELDSLPYQSPDNILESSYDYWAVSEIAGILGKAEDQKKYLQKANEFEEVYKEKFQVMDEQSDIMHGDGLYEGTLWQYRWFVPWNVPKMKALIGGEESFRKQLDQFFDINLYNHGNEPDIQTPFLYYYTDEPWKTQQLVNQILTKDMKQWYGTHDKWEAPYIGRIYNNQPEGYLKEMDDDAGTLSSWYVLSSIGLYPTFVGEPYYHVSTPIFKNIEIMTRGTKYLTIYNPDYNEDSFYIVRAKFDNKLIEDLRLSLSEIVNGTSLNIETSGTPSRQKTGH